MKKFLKRLLRIDAVERLFNGMKQPIVLNKLSNEMVKQYSMAAKELKKNLVWNDVVMVLKFRYQEEIVNKVANMKQLSIARTYLRVLDELELLVDQAATEAEMREQMKGMKDKKYLSN